MLHSHFSPFPVMRHYMTLLLNQKGLREAGSSMLYATKPHIDLSGNLACSRSGGSVFVWDEIKERIVPFLRGSVNQKNNSGSVAVVVTDRCSTCSFLWGTYKPTTHRFRVASYGEWCTTNSWWTKYIFLENIMESSTACVQQWLFIVLIIIEVAI